jgi:DNA-binding XRE family transcriptional regulator
MAGHDSSTLEMAGRFRAARRLAEVGAQEAADQLGISRATLNRIEKGTSPLKQIYIAWAISEWKAPPWLLPREEDEDPRERTGRELAEHARRALPPSGADDIGTRAPRRKGQRS